MNERTTTNIVVGRFQNPTLTEDQRNLLNYSLSTSNVKPIVVLGLSPLKCTAVNPLDFESRKSMIEAEYPNQFSFKYIKDQNSDKAWSENFDNIVENSVAATHTIGPIKILGSRDGFLDHYTGAYKDNFEEHIQTTYSSTVEQTKTYARDVKNTPEWRAGVAYAVSSQYPTVYPTVDCAIFDKDDYKQIYLARKKDEELYRFVGGFASPIDDSYEEAALREAKEETGLDCKDVKYLFSQKINDWRYRNETSKIITHMFLLVKECGRAKANDDICELKLFNFADLKEDMLQLEHRILLKKLIPMVNDIVKGSGNYYSTHKEADIAVRVMYRLSNLSVARTSSANTVFDDSIDFNEYINELSNEGVNWKHPDVMYEINNRFILKDSYDKWLKNN